MTLPSIRRYPDPPRLAHAAAAWVAGAIAAAVEEQGRVSIALAGGSTPRAMHAHLREMQLPWEHVHVYFGDERCVPPEHDDSNYRMVKETLLDHVKVGGVHRIEGELGAGEAAARYQDVLAMAGAIDLVVLGMGDDGHVASLFPETRDPEAGTFAIATKSPKPPPARVSMTLEAIAQARIVTMVVSGDAKAARLAEVYGQIRSGNPKLPAARVQGAGGAPYWLVDKAAGSLIIEEAP